MQKPLQVHQVLQTRMSNLGHELHIHAHFVVQRVNSEASCLMQRLLIANNVEIMNHLKRQDVCWKIKKKMIRMLPMRKKKK